MKEISQNFKEWKASSSEPKSPSAIDFAAGKRKSGIWTGEDEMQEEQHKRQCTEGLRSVPDSNLGASHPNAHSERPISNERQSDETPQTAQDSGWYTAFNPSEQRNSQKGRGINLSDDRCEREIAFLDLMKKSDEVAKASPKMAQDRLLNVLFTEKNFK